MKGNSTTTGIFIAVALMLLVAGVLIWHRSAALMPLSEDTSTSAQETSVISSATSTAAVATVVTYTDQGFSPSTVTVAQGDVVTFVNHSGRRMWVASDPHPIHSGYSGTTLRQHCPDTAGSAFDECKADDTYTFVFEKIGTWKYHNHASDEDAGTVVVIPK